ncbi:MAG: MotA/TolQ/ExbB proton channel family protein, partial [Rhodospirillales bacterium]|nr:MotA/TolQ/ExbB proton channel family protein [Rhodospirillales bacterium]
MPPRSVRTLVPALTLCLTGAAFAQDGGSAPAAQTTNVFSMFFWSSDIFGLLIIWLLILMSLVSIALSIMFTIQTRRSVILPDEVRDELEELIASKKYRDAIELAENDPSYLASLTNAALAEAGNGFSAMERAVEESSDVETSKLLRPIEFLNVLGNISPMLGLFGTVYGMIRAFEMLRTSSGQADPNELAGGISTALVTTLWGLIVAIPALTA